MTACLEGPFTMITTVEQNTGVTHGGWRGGGGGGGGSAYCMHVVGSGGEERSVLHGWGVAWSRVGQQPREAGYGQGDWAHGKCYLALPVALQRTAHSRQHPSCGTNVDDGTSASDTRMHPGAFPFLTRHPRTRVANMQYSFSDSSVAFGSVMYRRRARSQTPSYGSGIKRRTNGAAVL